MNEITPQDSLARSGSSVSSDERNQAMKLGISSNGRQFLYRDFKYDKLSDAIAYAEYDLSRQGSKSSVHTSVSWLDRPVPSGADEELMRQFGIAFDGTGYRYLDYRYDRLADAVNYAKAHKT